MSGPRTGTLYWLPRILDDESLDAVETLLMVGLADHVNADDECHVGIVRLAERARCSYGTARRRLAALEARGRLTRERRRREDGNLSTYLWTLVRDEPARRLGDGPARAQVRDDQRASGRAVTSAHQDARAEVPSDEPPSGEPPSGVVLDAEGVRFETLWQRYPQRNGKRVGKPNARKAWARLTVAQKDRAERNLTNYAAACDGGLTIAKDAERWLRVGATGGFEDWDEPARSTGARRSRIDDKVGQLQQHRQRPDLRAVGDGR